MRSPPDAAALARLRELTEAQLDAARADEWERVEALDADRSRLLRAPAAPAPGRATRVAESAPTPDPRARARELLALDAELLQLARAARSSAAGDFHDTRTQRRAGSAYREAAELPAARRGAPPP